MRDRSGRLLLPRGDAAFSSDIADDDDDVFWFDADAAGEIFAGAFFDSDGGVISIWVGVWHFVGVNCRAFVIGFLSSAC